MITDILHYMWTFSDHILVYCVQAHGPDFIWYTSGMLLHQSFDTASCSLFHDPLDSQAPPPCTLKSAPLAKIKPLGNTGAHKCSREAPSFQAAFAA